MEGLDGKVLYVRDIFAHYIKAQAKRCESVYWVSQSTKLSGPRYFLLMERDPSAQFYGVFRIMIGVAATGTPTGVMTAADGSPYSVAALSRLTKISKASLNKALPWLVEKKFLWLADTVGEAAGLILPPTRSERRAESDSESARSATRSATRTHTTPQELKTSPQTPPQAGAPSAPGASALALSPDDGPRYVQRVLAAQGLPFELLIRLSRVPTVTPQVVDAIAATRPDDVRSPAGWWLTQLKAAEAIAGDWK